MKKRFKTVVTTAMVAALTASLLTGCGSSTNDTTASAPETGEASDTAEASGGSDGDSDSILIAGIAPLTGSLASWGEGAINGYNLAIKEINEAGGVTIGDKTYTLESAVFADDKSDATEAISASTAKSSVLEESLVKQYTQNLLQSEEACRYLHKRRIANWVLEAYELGFDPEDKTVLFPVRGMDGKVIFYKGRSIAGKHFYNAKEIDKTSVVFGLWEILNGSFSWGTSDQIEEVWITESEIDALSLISYGVPAVAIMGSHISEDQCKELERTPFRRFVLATDNDDAGRKGASQIKRLLIPKGFRLHTSVSV